MTSKPRRRRAPLAFLCALAFTLLASGAASAQQAVDQAYTARIKATLQDPRITTELVDHLPASDTVPTPLKALGHIIGEPGVVDHVADIYRYFDALAAASPRVKVFRLGKTEEGREMILVAIADEATIRDLDRYRGMLASLGDPRKTTPAQAQQLIQSAKPIYYITSGIHSPEFGGPEMLMELAYRLTVDTSPFITNIRDNVITLITPVVEPDGRDKAVDTYNFNKAQPKGSQTLPLMYWGKYVQHDNNRDGMGQFLQLTKHVTQATLDWHPTILHDLHEAQTYLYASTGTGPYNEAIDPITVNEWWKLATTDVLEMTKRGVPGVFTYGFYDGWTPNYLFFIAHSHNATGRFYEVQSYGPDNYVVRPNKTTMSREWFRTNPPLASIQWGPRNNTNIQESAILFSLTDVADNRRTYLDDYWRKNENAVNKGRHGNISGWVIPANQRRKADAAIAINDLRRQGLEVSTANSAFNLGGVAVQAGDWIIRGDQPYRTIADMYFPVQHFSTANPTPYDDTGWTFPLMRDVVIEPVSDAKLLDQPMTLLTADAAAAGGIQGSGPVLVVDATGDTNLVAFRFRFPKVRMAAAEQDFTAAGHAFRAGAIVIANADRAQLEPALKQLGLSAWAMAAAPNVARHDLDVPRIGYVHSWQRTQDEGWVRAALDHYGIPYTYFGDIKLRDGNLRAKYDVIIYPHVGGSAQAMVEGIAKTGTRPLPYEKTARYPSLGTPDSAPDIRGGMGLPGLRNLVDFVRAGGTLIVEGATSTILPGYGLAPGITIEEPADLFVRGSILRGVIADRQSPIVYGIAGDELPVYFNASPVIRAFDPNKPVFNFSAFFGAGRRAAVDAQDVTPMAKDMPTSAWNPGGKPAAVPAKPAAEGNSFMAFAQQNAHTTDGPRVVLRFPEKASEMLLSGTLDHGEALSGRAQVVDEKLGNGHVVMFAIRPFWRWQTQGSYTLGFNAIMNWNHLDAGRSAAKDE